MNRLQLLIICICLLKCVNCQHLFSLSVGRWSECQRIDNTFNLYRTRNVTCVYKHSKVAPWHYCQQLGLPRPASRTECDTAMPIDCVTSLWSSWSSANSSSIQHQYRHRNIVLPPMFGGQKCPPTYESKPCSNCSMNHIDYQWRIGYWGSCEALLGPSNCGHGIRYRNITCVNRFGQAVHDSDCSAVFKPHNFGFENCEVPCDCKVSKWSAWSECKLNYDTMTYQQIRTRIIVKYPSHSNAYLSSCPSLQDTRPCSWGNCNLTYEVSGWSADCDLYNNNTNCGAGLRTRFLYCKKSCGNHTWYVDLSECKAYLNLAPPTTHVPCFTSCDRDCLLSHWSEWSQCTPFHGCNSEDPGYTFRERSVEVPQLESGKPCPHSIEIRRCVPDHCVHPRWYIKSFSSCHLTSNTTCGQGVITRDIDCVDNGGLRVSIDECLIGRSEKPPETVPCRVPCPHECVVSEWSMWLPCSKTCSGGIRKRNRHILAYDVMNCSATELQEVEPCNEEINCTSYEMYYGEWSKCNSVIPINVSTSYCTNGTQTRAVTCKIGNATLTCPAYFGGDTSRQCTECRNDCIKSQWYYTPCSVTCGNGGHRLKYRIVLWQGEDEACTNVDDNGKETVYEICLTMPSCQNHTWVRSKWSKCYFPIDEVCGIGYKNRSILCVNSSNHEVKDFYCMQSHLHKHTTFKECIVPCHDKCILTTWSKFGACSKSCGDSPGIRSRVRRVILPLGVKGAVDKNCPELKGRNLTEEQQCDVPKCTHYQWIVSNWSSCITNNSCGAGTQIRTILCASIKTNSTVFVSSSLCEQNSNPPVNVKNCTIECPVDCIVSEWKSWEPCSAECGIGFATRYRTVLQAPNTLGRPCPGLRQTTTRSCGEYKPGGWSTCVVTNATNTTEYCGSGKMFQNYSCYVDGHISDNHFCNDTISVTAFQDCYMPCSGDCVLTGWKEDLTTCSDCVDHSSCNTTATRKILRRPLPSGKQCGSLMKTEICPTVISYYWHTGPWLSCMLLNESNLCGSGFHTREVKCIRRHDNQIIPDYHCSEATDKPIHKELCNVKCPVDCMVSTFEPWSACNSSCDTNAKQTRYRDIVLNPNEYGRPCPHLNETRHCTVEVTKCYSYYLSYSKWSSCELNTGGNYCGNLTRHRSVDCIRNDGVYVHHEKCTDQYYNASIDTEEPCTVDCKLEKCRYSEWSDWSSCTTIETKNNTNFKFRSRHLLSYGIHDSLDCLSGQYETKECDDYSGMRLLLFKWRVSPWVLQGSRDVWCQSSDNISVSESACPNAVKPLDTLCPGGCSKGFYCDQISGYCQCHAGTELVNGECLPTEGCLTNAHCLLENTECKNLTCVCMQGYHMNVSKCIKDMESTSATMSSSPTSGSSNSANSQVSSSEFKIYSYACTYVHSYITYM